MTSVTIGMEENMEINSTILEQDELLEYHVENYFLHFYCAKCSIHFP